jgi:pyruvate/2-oxoglutarate dehydrogenase complex dihydrolipoamide acyltransferase (E2) component
MTDIKMPQLGESIAEGTIGQWLVEVGGMVKEDQPLVQVTTDKADIDIPSSVTGVLTEILAEEGQTVEVGALIARIDETVKSEKKEEKPKPAPKEETVKPKPEKVPEAAKPAPPVEKPAYRPASIEPQTQETALRADEPRQAGPVAYKKPENPAAKAISPGEPKLTEEGVPGEEAMPSREPEEHVTPPPEIAMPPGLPCEEDMAKFYSPAVMKLAIEHDIDLKTIEGTGDCGRVTRKDVMEAVERREGGLAPAPRPVPAQAKPAPVSEAVKPGPSTERVEGFGTYAPPVYEPEEGDTLDPFTRLRRFIADHMVYSKRTSPHVSTFAEVDMERVVLMRSKVKDEFKSDTRTSLTYLHFLIYAAALALADFPIMNSVVQADKILTKKRVHMGVAVDTDRGLFVPVIRNAGGMGLKEIAKAVSEIAGRVRDRKAGPDELRGGTFTVSNPGIRGNLFGTPIISQPQVGVLRMGEIVKRPVVAELEGEDAIVVRPMMYLSLSYDHRVVDGLTANEFLHRVKEYLERGEFTL